MKYKIFELEESDLLSENDIFGNEHTRITLSPINKYETYNSPSKAEVGLINHINKNDVGGDFTILPVFRSYYDIEENKYMLREE